MLILAILGCFLMIGGGFWAFDAHARGRENFVTLYGAVVAFGFGMLIMPAFMSGSTPSPITKAEAATSPVPALSTSGINLPTIRLDTNGRMITDSAWTSMGFDACLAVIPMVSTRVGVAPINIVETSIARIVRYPTTEGSGPVASANVPSFTDR